MCEQLVQLDLDEAAKHIKIIGNFDRRSQIELSKNLLNQLGDGAVLNIRRMGFQGDPPKIEMKIGYFSGLITVLAGSSGKIDIGNCGQLNIDVRIGHNSNLTIQNNTTANGAKIVAVNSDVRIGNDCMLSDEILIQGFDQHGIVNLKTMAIINSERGHITIQDHVWLGRRCSIMSKTNIGAGSIIGACSVVTKNIPDCTLAVGVPARVIKQDVTWCRPWTAIDTNSKIFIDQITSKYK